MVKHRSIRLGLFAAAFCTSLATFSGASAESTQVIVLQPSELIYRGNSLIRSGEISRAKKVLEKALKSKLTSTQTANAHNSMCVAYIREEHWRKAMDHCNAAIKLVSYNWRFYNNRGNIYLGLGQADLALDEYGAGLKIAPKSKTLLSNAQLAENQLALQENGHK